MKEYFNKHLNFKFYTSVEQEENGNYRFWICDSNGRICNYYSSDVILCLANDNKITEEEMQDLIAESLSDVTDFISFMDSFTMTYHFFSVQEIDKELSFYEIEQDYKSLSTQEKINLWYDLNDFANIFGDFIVTLI